MILVISLSSIQPPFRVLSWLRIAIPSSHAQLYFCLTAHTLNVTDSIFCECLQERFKSPTLISDHQKYTKVLPFQVINNCVSAWFEKLTMTEYKQSDISLLHIRSYIMKCWLFVDWILETFRLSCMYIALMDHVCWRLCAICWIFKNDDWLCRGGWLLGIVSPLPWLQGFLSTYSTLQWLKLVSVQRYWGWIEDGISLIQDSMSKDIGYVCNIQYSEIW